MLTENPHFSAEKKLEHEKSGEFQVRLSSILEAPLTVENINTFADDALNKLVDLTNEVAQKYKEETKSDKTIGELEDGAYVHYSLPNIGELLDRAQKKVDQIKSIEIFIKEKSQSTSDVITPPDATLESFPASGERIFEEKKLIPRLITLLYILETDFGISKDQVNLIQGQVKKEMVRQTPYFRVEIKPLDRVIYVCEEEKNASYIFDAQKLAEQSLSVDKLDLMTKEERNELIRQFPDIGRRLIQTKHWRENMSELLSGSLAKTETVEEKEQKAVEQDSNLPKASSSELDPWKNFWTDPETGKHYTSIFHLAVRNSINRYSIQGCLNKINSQARKIIINNRMVVEAYCLEDLLASPDYQNYANEPKVSKEFDEASGLWKNFYTDDRGKHWGSTRTIARKIGMTNKESLYDVIKNLPTKVISYAMNKKCQAYCFEDVLQIDYVKDFIEKIPEAETSGEWKGFWIDENGKHWAPMAVLSDRLSVYDETIKREMIENNIPSIEMRDISNRRTKAFCYEELASLEGIKLFIELPKVALEGEWKGFWTDENGKHWANVHNLATKCNFSANKLNKFIAKNEVTSRKLKDLTGRADDCYCYEDFIDLEEVKEYLFLPQVNKNGEWAGYYVDDKGNHWTTEKVLCMKFNLPKSAVSKYLEKVTERSVVRNINNARIEIFCLETLEKDIRFRDLIKNYIEGNSVLKTGEWKDFYIDGPGKHWGSERALSEKIKLSDTIIKRIIDILKLTPIKIKASNGIERDGYCYEDIANYSNPDSLLKYKKSKNKPS